jgi:hypothetical protein
MSWYRVFGWRLVLIVDQLFSFSNARPTAFQQPVGTLSGLFAMSISYCASIHVSSLYRGYKTHRWILGSPTCSSVVVALMFYYARSLCCQYSLLFALIAGLFIEGHGSL